MITMMIATSMMNVDVITIINVDVSERGELYYYSSPFVYREFIANSILLRPSKTIDLGQAKFIL